MGICASANDDGAEVDLQNAMLEEQLRQQRMEALFTFKILLLGAGEAGKSTIVKQLCLIHHKQPSEAELESIALTLHQNVIDVLQSIFAAAEKFEIEVDAEDKKTAEEVQDREEGQKIDADFCVKLKRFIDGPAFEATMKRRDEFWLLDSTNYYIEHLERFCDPDFRPNPEDQVQYRIRTTGIDVTKLEWKLPEPKEGEPDTLMLQMVDVGGQRNERKKWIHCFDDVKCILFIVNLAGYNQVLFEDLNQNRMTESLTVLNQISHKDIFANTPLYLFLNKTDLFQELIKKHPLSERFEDYKDGADLKKALAFVGEQFRAQLPANKGSNLNIFNVTGVSTPSITEAFLSVKMDLMEKNRPAIDAEKAKMAEEQKA